MWVCFIGNNVVGALVYADDIVLVAPTVSCLRKLMPVCGDYASEYCISFAAAKSKCLMVFLFLLIFLSTMLGVIKCSLSKNRRAVCN